ncbi:hypothetical protein E2986_11884 [Frieseomelitta varia]|uniref:Uncharacterized protein n=1 Tax=Frieseomelitta varia TaxID=561572 RepID=A0A833SAC9_9HYME|nr:hypothetical protein E2986_11884 [Frieseomelitta varia]
MDVEHGTQFVADFERQPRHPTIVSIATAQKRNAPPLLTTASNPYPFYTCNPSVGFQVTSFDFGTPAVVVQRFRFRFSPVTRHSSRFANSWILVNLSQLLPQRIFSDVQRI